MGSFEYADYNLKDFVLKRIRVARKQSNLSQKELGDGLGVSDKTVSAWEVGRAEPSLEMLEKIAGVTNRPIEFFMKDEDFSIASKLSAVENELREIREMLVEYEG